MFDVAEKLSETFKIAKQDACNVVSFWYGLAFRRKIGAKPMTMAYNFIIAMKNKLIGNSGYYSVQQQSVFEDLKAQAKHAYWFDLNGRECVYYVFDDDSRIAASNYFIR